MAGGNIRKIGPEFLEVSTTMPPFLAIGHSTRPLLHIMGPHPVRLARLRPDAPPRADGSAVPSEPTEAVAEVVAEDVTEAFTEVASEPVTPAVIPPGRCRIDSPARNTA
jgi:hypothetical protein